MAEVYFNTHNINPEYEAVSAGTGIKWDGKINPKVVALLLSKWIDINAQSKQYIPKVLDDSVLEWAEKVYTMGCMDSCIVWERKADFDFGLDDPASDETNIEEMWNDFETKIKAQMETLS